MTPEADRLARKLTTELENVYACIAGAHDAERRELHVAATSLEARIANVHRVEEAARAAGRGCLAAEIDEAREHAAAFHHDGTFGPWRDDSARREAIVEALEGTGIELVGELVAVADAAFAAAYLEAARRAVR